MKHLKLLTICFALAALALPACAAQQTIGVGSTANDGTGDSLRTAGGKINANFSELYTSVADLEAELAGYSANVQTLLGAANFAAFKTSLSLGNVENTALSTWAGSSNLTTLGTVTSGTFSGVLDGSVTMTLGSDATGDVYYRNASGFLTRLPIGANGTVLKVSSGLPSWGVDSGGSGSTGTMTTVKEDNVQVGGADIATIDFLGADFDLAESPDTEVQITIAAAIARDAEVAAGYQPLNANLTSIAALTTTSFGRGLLDDADASAGRTSLGIGNVENTALSTWAGSSNLTTLGTVTSGTFSGVLDGSVTMTLGSDGTGDVYYRNASGFLTRLAAGTNGDVLTLASGLPSWATPQNIDIGTPSEKSLVAVDASLNGFNITLGTGLSYGAGTVLTLDADLEDLADGSIAASKVSGLPDVWMVAISDETTAISTTGTKVTFRAPYAATVTAVRAGLTTASSSGTPTFDINEAGITILSTKLTVDASEKTSTTAAAAAVISDTSIADDAEMTIDVDVTGTGATGAEVYIYVTR